MKTVFRITAILNLLLVVLACICAVIAAINRCLDKAMSCSDKASAEYAASYVSCDEYYYHHAEFWNKWHKRWLEFAEKFKPNNEVNNA